MKLPKYIRLLWKMHKKILALERHLEISNRTIYFQYKTIENQIKTIERLEKEKTCLCTALTKDDNNFKDN